MTTLYHGRNTLSPTKLSLPNAEIDCCNIDLNKMAGLNPFIFTSLLTDVMHVCLCLNVIEMALDIKQVT